MSQTPPRIACSDALGISAGACAREQRRQCAAVAEPDRSSVRPIISTPGRPPGNSQPTHDIRASPDAANAAAVRAAAAAVRSRASRVTARAERAAAPAAAARIERRLGAGRHRLHERAEVGLGGHRDQGLRRRDRRDAEKSRQRLLLPRQRQIRQERFRRRDRRLRPGAAARSRRTPTISTAAPRPTKPRRMSTARSPTTTRRSRPVPIRSTPTTIAARSFNARATSPAPPPTTAR